MLSSHKVRKNICVIFVSILFIFICSCSNDMNQIKEECLEEIEYHYYKIKEEAFFYTSKLVDYEFYKAKEELKSLSKKSAINQLRTTTIKRLDDLCLSESEYLKIKELFLEDDYQKNNILRLSYFENNFDLEAFYGKFNDCYFFSVQKYYEINIHSCVYPYVPPIIATDFYSQDEKLHSTIYKSICCVFNNTTFVRHNVDANIKTPLSQEEFLRFIEYNSVYSNKKYKVYSENSSFEVIPLTTILTN